MKCSKLHNIVAAFWELSLIDNLLIGHSLQKYLSLCLFQSGISTIIICITYLELITRSRAGIEHLMTDLKSKHEPGSVYNIKITKRSLFFTSTCYIN